MATTGQAIQILTTLEYLGKYGGVPYFGLVLQTSVGNMPGGTLDLATADVKNILEPWMWWDPAKTQPGAPTDTQKPINVQQPKIDIWSATPAAPVPKLINPGLDPIAHTLDRSITDQLDKDCTNAIAPIDGNHYLSWSDPASIKSANSEPVTRRSDGRSILPWPAHLAQVTRYPYPIPHLLNLSFLLKVQSFDPSKFDPATYFFATVSFNVVVNGKSVTYSSPDPQNDQDKFNPPDGNSRLVIPLINPADATDRSLAVTTQALLLKGLSPAAFLVSSSTPGYTAESADWQAHLSSSVAATFDLSARLVDTVRQACDKASGPPPANVAAKQQYDEATRLRSVVAAEFPGFITAVLTSQREIVAYGCQAGPNGKSLLDRLLDAWVGGSVPANRSFADDFSKAVTVKRTADRGDNVGAFDKWLYWLKSIPALTTNSLLPPCPAGLTATLFDGTNTEYKKGDTVIFHGRSFTAISDMKAPAVPPLDVESWKSLTPLLPFYVKGKLYKSDDVVLFRDVAYQAISDTATQPASPGAAWTPVGPFVRIHAAGTSYNLGDRVLFQDSVYRAIADANPGQPQPSPPDSSNWVLITKVDPTRLPDGLIAVEQLQLQLTQREILSQILLAQWKSVSESISASWSASQKAQFQSFLNSASANLAVWDIRGLLLNCHLDQSWTTITKAAASRDTLRDTIQTELGSRLDGLLTTLPTAPVTTPAFGGPLKVKVGAWMEDRKNLLVPAANTATIQPTRSAQGLSVMVGTLDSNGGQTDQFDPLRSFAGYCVLMRPVGATDWRCLNAGIPIANVANATAPPGTSTVSAVHDLADPIVIPLPLHNQDGLRRATLTYDNQPLMCSSPAHAFGDGLVPAPKRDASRNFDRMISFQHLSVTKELANGDASLERWKIPGLAFKQSYEFLLGAVSNSGALPAELADPGNPALFSFVSLKQKKPAATITQVSYLRTVPIGDLRFASSFSPTPLPDTPSVPPPEKAGTFDKLSFPPIPADVQPRANEVFASSLAPIPTVQGQPQAPPAVGTPPAKPSKPLVLLSPYQTVENKSYAEFDLWIRKPTTDFLTWDRTQAGIAGTHKARQWAWQLFNMNARKQNSKFDLSLEDAAIDTLIVSVRDESGALVNVNGVTALPWPNADIQNPATATALQTPTQPILLRIVTSIGASTKFMGSLAADAKSSPTFTLTIPQGFLGSITLQPKLKSGFEKQFAAGISSAPSAYTLLIETASSAFPQQDDLQKALSIQPPVASADPVSFTLVSQSGQAAWKQISRVDLQAQLWRWDGRPARSFPFDQITPVKYYGGVATVDPKTPLPVPPPQRVTTPLLQWELETFATRTASDSITRPMVRRSNNFIANEDRGTELGATYFRAGIIAYNRYGSLVPESMVATDKSTLQVRSATSLNSFASIPGADGAWVRRFIPGRYTIDGSKPASYKPPKPAIKYIVPLTEAYDGSHQAASSVLVVVQGPWFALAGLAEDISVQIVDVDPKDHPVGNNWKEAGPDPIYYQKSSDQPLPDSFADYLSPFTPPSGKNPLFHGPIGHTFDSSDTNPLWITSSFVLDPPHELFKPPVADGKDATQEGTFAQIQFRRIVHADGMVIADPYKTPPQHGKEIPALKLATLAVAADTKANPPQPAQPAIGDISSDSTDPVWVQFLPSRFLPVSSNQDFDMLVGNYDTKSTVTICDASTNASKPITLTHNLHPDPKYPNDYLFALLLTQEVPDLLGRRGQERFVEMLLQAPTKSVAALWTYDSTESKVDPSNQDLIARIVVIQRQVNTTALTPCFDPPVPPPAPPSEPKLPQCDVRTAEALWEEMFPQAPGSDTLPEKANDAISRIVAVSPPIPAYNRTASLKSCKVDTTFNPQISEGNGD